MDINEWIAIGFGLLVGYWVVSRLLSDPGNPPPPPPPPPEQKPDRDDFPGT